MLDQKGIALATRCLWTLQEIAQEIEGLLLIDISGMIITTTLDDSENTQRLAAVSAAMYLLGEHTSEAWGSGEPLEIQVHLSTDDLNLPAMTRYVSLKPAGLHAILVALHRASERSVLVDADLDQAARYLETLLTGNTTPPPARWQSR